MKVKKNKNLIRYKSNKENYIGVARRETEVALKLNNWVDRKIGGGGVFDRVEGNDNVDAALV